MATTEQSGYVLVALDASAEAGAAVDWAAQLARRLNTQVALLHVDLAGDQPGDRGAAGGRLLEGTAAKLRRRRLRPISELRRSDRGRRVAEILDAARGKRILVLGWDGMPPVVADFIGSVCHRIAGNPATPTVLVKVGMRFSRRRKPFVLAAVEAVADGPDALDGAIPIFKALNAQVHVLHVFGPAEGAMAGLVGGTKDHGQHVIAGTLERLAAAGVTARGSVVWNRAGLGDEIVAAARRLNADLVVVGSDQRPDLDDWLLGTVAESVLRHSPCPVMVLPAVPPG